GLASIIYHKHEELLLSGTNTPEETDRVYCHRCIPTKARLDLIYQAHQSICFDVLIMSKTVFKFIRLKSIIKMNFRNRVGK
ncbi:MAG: hypothetical protein ACRCT6_04840, partial [Notoacmeibacter sp.]